MLNCFFRRCYNNSLPPLNFAELDKLEPFGQDLTFSPLSELQCGFQVQKSTSLELLSVNIYILHTIG